MLSMLYIILGIVGLGFLVFIHELGHYIVAKRVGMKVEVFSIGFGKPFYTFMVGDVKWQLCYLIFGGYVKIAGMEREGDKDPSEIKNGFFGKSPFDRIKVAIAGPLVNIVFAFLVFTGIFLLGGRDKPFSEYTKIIGYVDTKSEAYQKGLRPGDTLSAIDDTPFKGINDLLYSAVINKNEVDVKGDKIDYFSQTKKPYNYELSLYPHPNATKPGIRTFGIIDPAMFLVYDHFSDGRKNPIPKGSPMYTSGIKPNDRLLWVDGELIFSLTQLQSIVNKNTSLVVVQRNNTTKMLRVPRMPIKDLRMNQEQLAEIDDWQHEVGMKGSVENLTFIPYSIDAYCTVEYPLSFIDNDSKQTNVGALSTSSLDQPLQKGDRILSVDGKKVSSGFQLLKEIQQKRVQIIVNSEKKIPNMNWQNQDSVFMNTVPWQDLQAMIASMHSAQPIKEKSTLRLLNPIAPIAHKDFPRSEEKQAKLDEQIEKYYSQIQNIKDPIKRKQALAALEQYQNRLFLGIALQDQKVTYNPPPWILFNQVCKDIFKTIGALFSGNLSPKWMSGPIAFVQVMHHGWSIGFKEALYWLGMISLGLGFSNLLPIPVLDGGYICFSLWEIITGTRIKAKVMEKMIIPFVVLMILFFVFVTYHDLVRLFEKFR